MPTCWYAEECPYSHECTKASWDRCRRCASYDGEAACRKLLFTHCIKSGHHYGNHTHEEVEIAVADAVILTAEVEDEEPEPPPEPLPPKRQRQTGSWQGYGHSSSSSAHAQVQHSQQISIVQPAVVAVPQGEMITLPKTVLKAVFDCLDRAVSATKHAVKLSAAARAAFEEEVEKMTETREEAHKWINKF